MLGELVVILVIALIVFGPMLLKARKKSDDE
jgi:Sec-independent protein translocase protein TatA